MEAADRNGSPAITEPGGSPWLIQLEPKLELVLAATEVAMAARARLTATASFVLAADSAAIMSVRTLGVHLPERSRTVELILAADQLRSLADGTISLAAAG